MLSRLMKYSIFTLALFIGVFIVVGFALSADECQDECSFTTKKGDVVEIGVLPDSNNNWPIEVTAPGGEFSCGASENYPCLAWPYQCLGDENGNNCEAINKQSIFISNCCGKPIEILAASDAATIRECEDTGSLFPNMCSGYELRIPSTSGNSPGETLFWFTTPKDVGTDMVDIMVSTGSIDVPCIAGIKGPGCSTPIPPVRVEPRVQCFQFTADTDNCSIAQTWYLKWAGTGPCAVEVHVAEGIVPCSDFPNGFVKLESEPLGDITINVDGDDQVLTEALINNSACDEGWLRFVDSFGCNVRCYYSGGRRYCY